MLRLLKLHDDVLSTLRLTPGSVVSSGSLSDSIEFNREDRILKTIFAFLFTISSSPVL